MQKEVNRLRVLVNCGAENPESDGLAASVSGSPGSFKWDAGLGSFSPLTFDKKISQVCIFDIQFTLHCFIIDMLAAGSCKELLFSSFFLILFSLWQL